MAARSNFAIILDLEMKSDMLYIRSPPCEIGIVSIQDGFVRKRPSLYLHCRCFENTLLHKGTDVQFPLHAARHAEIILDCRDEEGCTEGMFILPDLQLLQNFLGKLTWTRQAEILITKNVLADQDGSAIRQANQPFFRYKLGSSVQRL